MSTILGISDYLGECFACKGPVYESDGRWLNNTAAGTSLLSHNAGKCYPRTMKLGAGEPQPHGKETK